MNKIQRRRLRRNIIGTVLLTVLAVIMQWGDVLGRVERVFYDYRAVHCHHERPPTDRLVHLDIDDGAIDQIGRWPWDRATFADILDEIRLAGPKVVALDLVYSEPSHKTYDKAGHLLDPDARLTAVVRASNNILIPSSYAIIPPPPSTGIDKVVLEVLKDNPELSQAQCAAVVESRGLHSGTLAEDVAKGFVENRNKAIYDRIQQELDSGATDVEKIRRRILPHFDPVVVTSASRVFDDQFTRISQERSQLRFMLPVPAKLPPFLHAQLALTPILPLSDAARYGAFVDYLPDIEDGKVRAVPLVAVYHGHMMPHMGLAMACAALDVNVADLRFSYDSITLPQPGGHDIVIPAPPRETQRGEVGMLMAIPWFGKKEGWEQMYDYPRFKERAKHVSLSRIWQLLEARQRLASNEKAADMVLVKALALTDPKAASDYEAAPLMGTAKGQLIAATLTNLGELIKALASETDPDTRKLVATYKEADALLREVLKQDAILTSQIALFRRSLRETLQGRAALIGFVATGNSDKVATSLDAQCPGVIIHGVVFNAIMTRNLWRKAPDYVTYLIIGTVGLLVGLVVSSLSPFKALLITLGLIVGYALINGFVLLYLFNLLVGVSGPLAAGLLVWSGITIPNFINEIAERNRITRRFSSYVDPSLVSYVIENPDLARFAGEAREMTMGFTDIQGFTTLTESLGPRTVPLLAEYMGLMIPRIRAHNGYVSRLMGDGIYFFYNAPRNDPDHALHAVSTVLSMHEALDQMNLTLPARNYPTLFMRAGLCTGRVIVGDAGSKEFFDYTAVGDSVNTAARFESANKFFGTKILASARTMELVNGQFLVRPVANIRVVGKTKGTEVFEPLCRMDQVTPQKLKLAEISTRIFTTFQAAEFEACIAAVDVLEGTYGKSKYSALYRSLSQEYLIKRPDDFNGQVVLSEK